VTNPSQPSLLLALDGSAPRFSIALADADGTLLAEEVLDQAAASRTLFAALDRALVHAGARRGDLAGIVATRGPGSFTGVRLALAAAMGLCQALGTDGAAVGSLEALAECAPPDAERVVTAIDALRGEWYTQTFVGPRRLPESDPTRVPDALLPRNGWLIGFGLERLGDPSQTTSHTTPDRGLAAAALRAFARHGAIWQLADLSQPIYLREAATTPAPPTRHSGASS
jgi:tRNA threonylcarbamoyladenosine biosynthesis protein TsaB